MKSPSTTLLPREAPIEIMWNAAMRKDLRAVVEPMVAKWAHFLPRECQQIAVRYVTSQEERAVGHAFAEPQYRHGRIDLTEHFMDQSDNDRERTVLHEILHITIWPLKSEIENLIADVYDDSEGDPYLSRFSRAYSALEDSVIEAIVFAVIPPETCE